MENLIAVFQASVWCGVAFLRRTIGGHTPTQARDGLVLICDIWPRVNAGGSIPPLRILCKEGRYVGIFSEKSTSGSGYINK